MVICHCEFVNDRVIAEIVAADGEMTVEGVTARCGAGGRCGGCRPAIEQLLDRVTPVRVAAA